MRSIIDDKMYELITKEENFKFAYDINERFNSIRERVIQEFWESLALRFKEEFREFEFSNRNNHHLHFDISIKSLKMILFFIEIEDYQFQYGISISNNGTKKRIREIEIKFEGEFEANFHDEIDKTSWFYQCGEENFDSFTDLKKILPQNRNYLIDKYIRDFKSIINSKQECFLEFEDSLK